ncbi:MAG: SoxR reducing system RseC family protein [Nitrospirota bacterium]
MERSDIETGTVLEIQGTSATVITNKSKSCKECGKAEAGICGKKGDGIIIKADNSIGAVKGDTVEIGLAKKTHLAALFIVFILPVAALIISAFAGHLVSLSTGIGRLDVIAGLSGLILSLFYSFLKIHRMDKSIQFYITNILNNSAGHEISTCPEEMDYLAGFGRKS